MGSYIYIITMQGIALFLLLPCCAMSQVSLCHDYAVNECNKDKDGELLTLNAASQLNCHEYCKITEGCLFYSFYEKPIQNVNCHLFGEPFHVYLNHCDVHSGPLTQNPTSKCLNPEENSCELNHYEECVLYGTALERKLAAPEVSVCEEFCRINQGQGCKYWQWNRERETCDLFDSAEKRCNVKFGPKQFSPDECGSVGTSTHFGRSEL